MPTQSIRQQVRPKLISKHIGALTIIALIIIIYECLSLLGDSTSEIIRITLGFVLIFAVVYSAIRYGLRPGLLAATLSNMYLIYSFSGPERNIVPLENMLQGEWLILLVLFAPAILIGYLRDKIDDLIYREKEARFYAEQGERRLAHILQHMPVGVVIAKAPTGEVTFSNDHLNQLMGHQVEKDKGYEQYPDNRLVDEDGKPLKKEDWPLYRVINNQEYLMNEEYHFANDDSTSIFKVRGIPIYDEGNTIESGLVIVDDITSEKEMEQRKDDFISVISHELKTPITSLKIYTQFLAKKYANKKPDDLSLSLNKINEQADKLQRLVDGMLYIAQTRTDKLSYQLETKDLSEALHEVVNDAEIIISDHNIVVNCKPKVYAQIDTDRFSQVIINLITNASKFSPPNTDIIVTLESTESSALISVKDHGIGITNKDAKKIFDRFFQSTRPNNQSHGGLGIGLYVVADIVNQHNGEIWVESNNNQGSTFTISLPLSQ